MRMGANLLMVSESLIRDPPNPKEKSARAFKEEIYFTPTSIYTAILLFFSEENHFSSS